MTCVWSRTRRPSSARGGVSMGRARSLRHEPRVATHGSVLRARPRTARSPARARRGPRAPASAERRRTSVALIRIVSSEAASVALYTSSPTWPAPRATWTRMNENSPIWVRPTPTSSAVTSGYPKSRTTSAQITSLPTTTRPMIAISSGRLATTLRRVDERADRDEEDRHEDVAHRQQAGQRLVRVVGVADHQPGQEGAEGHREPDRLGQRGRAEPERQRHHEEELVVAGAGHAQQQRRHDLPRQVGERRQDPRRLPERACDGQQPAGLQRPQHRQQHGQHDHRQVLHERDADHHPAVARLQLAAVDQQPRQHHRAGHRHHDADHRCPAEAGQPSSAPTPSPSRAAQSAMPSGTPDERHPASRGARSRQRELDADGEHQEHDADLRHSSKVWTSETVGPGVNGPMRMPPAT